MGVAHTCLYSSSHVTSFSFRVNFWVMPEQAVTWPGDIWVIGNHRLICGDSTKAETYQQLLGDERTQMVFCDAPYNIAVNDHVSGLR